MLLAKAGRSGKHQQEQSLPNLGASFKASPVARLLGPFGLKGMTSYALIAWSWVGVGCGWIHQKAKKNKSHLCQHCSMGLG